MHYCVVMYYLSDRLHPAQLHMHICTDHDDERCSGHEDEQLQLWPPDPGRLDATTSHQSQRDAHRVRLLVPVLGSQRRQSDGHGFMCNCGEWFSTNDATLLLTDTATVT
jgi:hypothetical protein